MKIDPQASRVTSLFMVLALIVMAALAWSVQRDKNEADGAPAPAAADAAVPPPASE